LTPITDITTNAPQAGFDPFDQRLETLGEADLDGFHVGVAEHQVEHQVWERHTAQGDAQRFHVRKVRLCLHTRLMDLSEHHLPRGTVLSSPGGYVYLEGSDLTLLIHRLAHRIVGTVAAHQHAKFFEAEPGHLQARFDGLSFDESPPVSMIRGAEGTWGEGVRGTPGFWAILLAAIGQVH